MNRIKEKIKSDVGLMGRTHALSALAFSLVLVSFFPSFLFNRVLQTNDIIVLIAALFVICGYAMWPDFDNSKSTAISTFGFVGEMISSLMRSSAIVVYSLVKSKNDDPKPNPHRSFWHTFISALLLGLILILTTMIGKIITIPYLNKQVSIGFLFAILWIYIGVKLAIAGLLGDWLKKIKNKGIIKSIGFEIFAIGFSLAVLLLSPGTLKYTWIGYAAILGYIVHLLGDCLTVSGAPILWPLKHKGKRWWSYRFIGFRAGGQVEQILITPLFTLIIVLCIFRLIYFSILR